MHAQLCPKCNGQGVVGTPPGQVGSLTEDGKYRVFTAGQTSWPCDLCHGQLYINVPD